MTGNNGGLDRLCIVYENLDDRDKEKIIKLAEGLLNSQSLINKEELQTFKFENIKLEN